jgi:hypothetical protein
MQQKRCENLIKVRSQIWTGSDHLKITTPPTAPVESAGTAEKITQPLKHLLNRKLFELFELFDKKVQNY